MYSVLILILLDIEDSHQTWRNVYTYIDDYTFIIKAQVLMAVW